MAVLDVLGKPLANNERLERVLDLFAQALDVLVDKGITQVPKHRILVTAGDALFRQRKGMVDGVHEERRMPTQLILANGDAKLCCPQAIEHDLEAMEDGRAEDFMAAAILAKIEPQSGVGIMTLANLLFVWV